MSQTEPQFKLRLPEGLLNQVKADALANGRSVNAEIVMRIRDHNTPLRDWFAGQALAGMCAFHGTYGGGNGPDNNAARAYEQADAMLKARER